MGNQAVNEAIKEFQANFLSFGILHPANDTLYNYLDEHHASCDPIKQIEHDEATGSFEIRNDGFAGLRTNAFAIADPHETEAEKKEEERRKNGGHTYSESKFIECLAAETREIVKNVIGDSFYTHGDFVNYTHDDFVKHDKVNLTAGTYAGEAVYDSKGMKFVPVYSQSTGAELYKDNGKSCEVTPEAMQQPIYWDNGLSCEIELPKETSSINPSLAPTIENAERQNSIFTEKGTISFGLTEQPDMLSDLNLKLLPEAPNQISAAPVEVVTPVDANKAFNTAAPNNTETPVTTLSTDLSLVKKPAPAASNDPAFSLSA